MTLQEQWFSSLCYHYKYLQQQVPQPPIVIAQAGKQLLLQYHQGLAAPQLQLVTAPQVSQ